MTLARRKALRATIFLSFVIAFTCPPPGSGTKLQSAGGRSNPTQARDVPAKPPIRPPDLEAFAAEAEAAPPEIASGLGVARVTPRRGARH
jgi:hypothetical protein